MKDLENELSQKSLKIIDLEQKLKENENIINDYKNKNALIDKELNENKSLIFDLKKEKENLLRDKDFSQNNVENILQYEIKNKDQERKLELLKKRIQNLENDNKTLRNKMNDYEEIKLELESFKNRGTNYNYIEVNKTSLKREYDKLIEENKSLKKSLEIKQNK